MLETIRRWFKGAREQEGSPAVAEWARAAGHGFKRSRDGEGFVVEPASLHRGWRLEWGPSQRLYIFGAELRLRGDLGGAHELQMLVLSKLLMVALEKEVFEQFTEGLQTRIDTDTPEEMRWLVLYPKKPVAELRDLREAFGAVANQAQALSQWLEGPLAAQLQAADRSWLPRDKPFVLVVQRGRLTLRTAMAEPDPARIEALVGLFELALREARRVAEVWGSPHASTTPSLWHGTTADAQPHGE